MRKPAFTLAALLATTVLAACGGVDKNAYVTQVTKVQQATQQDARALSDKMESAKTPAQVATNLAALGTAVEKNAADLKAIEAPESVAAKHQEYVDLMQQYGADLEDLAAQVKTATPATVRGILTKASTLTTKLSTQETKIVSAINTELQS